MQFLADNDISLSYGRNKRHVSRDLTISPISNGRADFSLSLSLSLSLVRLLTRSLVHDAETINSISNRSDPGRAPVNLSLSFSSPLTPTAVAAVAAAGVALFSPLLPSI